jgi:hypothetical protein
MSEHRETANAAMYQAIPRLAGDIAPFDYAQGRLWQGGRFHAFSQKLHRMQVFCEKEKKRTTLPQAKYAIIGSKRPV